MAGYSNRHAPESKHAKWGTIIGATGLLVAIIALVVSLVK